MRRRALVGLAVLLGPLCAPLPAQPQPRQQMPLRPAVPAPGPALSASRSLMAGSMLSVMVSRAPPGARLAISRPADPADSAIIVVELRGRPSGAMPIPGIAATYELRLTRDEAGAPVILSRQPLVATEAQATLAAPGRVRRKAAFPARGIGPNGAADRVVLVPKDAPVEASGPSFFPAENVEATLDAPDAPGDYELRYVMNAPLAEGRVLARQVVVVE